jgi:3-oxoacyl-[acyl-carrier protein] reductase
MNIIITGASSGVGLALTLALAKAGHQVVGLARKVQSLEDEAAVQALTLKAVSCDVTDAQQVQKVISDLVGAWGGRLDVLINNAAVFEKVPFVQQSFAQIDRLVDTNLKGVLYSTRSALPYLLAQKSGHIIMISSVAGTRGIPGESTYCSTKHGVNGFAEALAQEVLDQGVKVTTLCPGGIDTALWHDGNPYGGDKSKIMQPSELVDAVNYVLSMPKTTYMKRMVFFPTGEWH